MTENWRPDWRDLSNYPDHGNDQKRWLWEFLRRDKKYSDALPDIIRISRGTFYTPLCFDTDKAPAPKYHVSPTKKERQRLYDYAQQFAIDVTFSRPDPSEDNPKFHPYGYQVTWLRHGGFSWGNQSIEPQDISEVAFKFDLTFPIKGQLEQVQKELEAMQRELLKKYKLNFQRGRKWDQFAKYLLILDWLDDGGTKAELHRSIYGDYAPDVNNFDKLNGLIKSAESMQNRGYRQLTVDVDPHTKSYYRHFC